MILMKHVAHEDTGNAYKHLVGKKDATNLEDTGVDGMTLLKCIFRK
jgi:hypothetical protein